MIELTLEEWRLIRGPLADSVRAWRQSINRRDPYVSEAQRKSLESVCRSKEVALEKVDEHISTLEALLAALPTDSAPVNLQRDEYAPALCPLFVVRGGYGDDDEMLDSSWTTTVEVCDEELLTGESLTSRCNSRRR